MNLKKRFFYLCGQIGIMALVRYFYQWIIAFAATEIPDSTGAGRATLFSAAAVGALLLVFRIFDGATDPVAGMVSDGWVRRGHRRQSLLWFSFFIPSLGLLLCFLPSPEMSRSLRWLLLSGGMFVFVVGYTMYAVPYWSLIDDYSNDNDKLRRSLSNILGAGLLLATGLAFVVSPLLVQRWGFFRAAVYLAVPALILMILPYYAAPDRVGAKRQATASESLSVGQSLRIVLKHRRFLAMVLLFSGSQMSFTIMTAAAPFIAVDLLGGDKELVALLLGPLLVVAIPCFLLAPKISARWGWERAVVGAAVSLAVVYALTALLGDDRGSGPAMLLFALGGPMVAIFLGLEGEAIIACARETGGGSIGLYFGVYNLVIQGMNGVAILLAGVLAELSRGKLDLLAVRLMGPIAGICLLSGMILYLILRRSRSQMT